MSTESINQWFENSFKAFACNKAVTFFRNGEMETQLTYDQLHNDINRFSNFLSARGLKKGDRVILLLEKSVINVVACVALLKIGAVVVPLNPGFKKNELNYLLKDSKAEMVIAGLDKKELIEEIYPCATFLQIPTHLPYEDLEFFRSCPQSFFNPKLSQNDPGLIIYTSGTTGNPKGAVLSHANLVCDAENVISIWDITQKDVVCHALPLFHVHGLCFALFTALLSGSHVMMLDGFTPETVQQRLSSKNPDDTCSIFMAVPAMYTRLLDFVEGKKNDFSHMRLWTSGSAPLLEKEFDRITRICGKNPVEREGMSETGMNFSNPLNGRKKPGSIGIPLPGVTVRIVNPETCEDVTPGEVGEIWLKSLSITKGYWEKPVETADTFQDGWFKTGDLGKKDQDGYYYLTDRIKHLIITGGENVSAKEVETVINQLEGVKEAAVVGIPDEKWGEKVVALVEKYPGVELSESKIKAVCKEQLHNLKCPKKIIFSDHIPKNTMGKVLKEKVKQFFHSY
ncbi:class I adenylate-forming enzyme family protein [Desulfobacula toluolica]|uniref:LcfB6: long-chain-fatty-acid--CoA ligase n=1 Tax=Desulfobacula toluolica (strain DSM 7467 / Tol2) TaxID=651182 RepID=K0NCJ7_DESTT|nr:AMP-binding protein [Desulfobacula toluolica]CCK82239.1 LcfB6: long-chain-fatty-acid--CoA ligase [Desulfobacula toluolica Tol2]